MRKLIATAVASVSTVLVGANAYATVTMTLADATTYAEAGFTASLNGSQMLPSDGLIGIYSFNVNPGSEPNVSTPFYSTCLSPDGVLDWGTHTYDLLTFQQANPGLNPSSWAYSGTALWGIQNANYLFSALSGQIIGGGIHGEAGTVADQGAAMALAMYAALYNSTGYGQLGGSAFSVTSGLAGNVLTDYTDDINSLKGATINLVSGYVLRPDPVGSGSGQDMILLGSGLPNDYSTVPEPATIMAAALLLLPVGASTIRIVRRNRAFAKL